MSNGTPQPPIVPPQNLCQELLKKWWGIWEAYDKLTSGGVQSYTIGSRSVTYMDVEQLWLELERLGRLIKAVCGIDMGLGSLSPVASKRVIQRDL